MEILTTVEYVLEYWLALGFFSFLSIAFYVLSMVGASFIAKEPTSNENKFVTGIFVVFSIACICLVCSIVDRGVLVEYKAKITDYNEIYEQGYEIVDKEDKLYTLKKIKE